MVKKNYVPERGDAVWLSFDPQTGREQAGRRPALVLSPSEYNGKVGLAIFCPITNQPKDYNWEVAIPKGHKVKGAVLSDQVRSLDWRQRKADFLCKLPEEVLTEVLEKLAPLLEPATPESDEEADG
ncbi:MAG: type II toxin-antitoxin system PemK/MazF family toxin [Gemmataceae bacterium]|nr:type II toxin-antitoxin system PemK/MazF family toxin [Gemmataceae bacterium]